MLAELSVSEFNRWRAYAEREPFGPQAWDARIGYVLAVLVNALTGQRTEPSQFIPRWGDEDQPAQDWRAMYRTFQEWKQCQR